MTAYAYLQYGQIDGGGQIEMNGSDWFGVVLIVLTWLWEHRDGVAILIGLAILVGIMNNLQVIATELHLIEEVIKDRFPEPDDHDEFI